MERTEEPFFSVVIAVRNGATTLERCLQSIAAQTCTAREVIVIDGASTDGTVDIVRGHPSVVEYWCSEPDHGIPDAWNKGVARARGKWVLFLGADDYFLSSDALARAKRMLEEVQPGAGIAYGQVALVSRSGEVLDHAGRPWEAAGPAFRAQMTLPHQGVFHRRTWFDALGPFDVKLRICADYDFLLRAFQQCEPVFLPGLVVAAAQHGGISSVPANAMTLLREARAAQRKHGMRRVSWPWIVSWAKIRVRQVLWFAVGERNARRCLDCGRRVLGKPPIWTRV